MPNRHEAEIRAVQRELGEALARRDLDHAISLMTADVALLGSKGPAVIGHEAARRLYADLFDRFTISVAHADCTIDAIGETALVVERQTTTLTPRKGGRSITVTVRVVGVYRLEHDVWKLARALSVVAGRTSTSGISAYTAHSELLRRAQAEPGRIICPQVA